MLSLLSLLQSHRFWPGDELASRLEVSGRTLRRDIERLRDLGYVVDASRGAAGGYQLRAGGQLPPLLLEDDEAVAIAAGLRSAAAGSVGGLEATSVAGVLGRVRNVSYPRGETWDGGAGPVPVYRGRVKIEGEIEHRGGGAPAVEITYQVCDETRCLPVVTRIIRVR